MTPDRRRFLALGGVAALAVVGACGTKNDSSGEATATTTTSMAPSAADVAFLRNASSLEELEVALYKKALDGGLLKTPAVLETVKLFQAQHQNHAALFEGHTTRLGGPPDAQPNAALRGRLASATDEASVLRLAVELALATTATYQSGVGVVSDAALSVVLMSVAGVEARHAALLGTMINLPVAPASFATTERAVH